jgi:hypothetical protein
VAGIELPDPLILEVRWLLYPPHTVGNILVELDIADRAEDLGCGRLDGFLDCLG